ncbi:BTAD domain-containing putative transcriptional regulator [Modestobacter sp. I12A-02662]|uniref:BTAD domain-containing putative transcriptional regulator n=1 Tax=Modestobacter sp. I12A-02662 TaxID=1730496 RepID=UPI0034DF2926
MVGTTELRVNLLGELTASCAGAPLDLGGPRQRAVLAVLLLARGEIVPADRLVESVWGDHPPADTSGALQAYISHLRRRLEPGTAARTRSAVIVRQGPGYAVRLPGDAVDAWRFETLVHRAATAAPDQAVDLLREALGLWRGPALADYPDAPWAEAEIGRLTELRAAARERLLAARLDLGEAALLIPDLEAMVAEEPLREERWRLLALALYRSDRQADALAALRRARATLADELGVDPGPALRELEDAVLAQSPALRSPPRRMPGPAPRLAAARAAPDDLADRDRELAAVGEALDGLAEGRPGLLLVEGPAGIGKTRLLAEARRLAAERSVRVLTARGSQLEKAFGFGAVRQLFEPELMAADRREELLSGAAAPARAVFDLAPGEAPEGSFAALHGLYWLAVELAAAGPLLLSVDDLQWCDSASLRCLAYLVRRLDDVPVLIVGTVRTGEQHDDEELLAELALEPTAVVVRPAPLSAEATTRIVGRRLGEPVSPLFARACHRTTSGNPLLLRQLLRGLEADRVRPDAAHADTVVAVGSRAVSSMVLVRLRRVPPDVPAVARAAAVLGDGAPLPVVAALAGLPEQQTAAALAVLARAEIVKDEQPLAFVHPLVRDAVYRDLPAAERGLRHEEAARLLRAAGASDEQVAAHLLLAPPRADEVTTDVLRRAARTAADRGASDSAVTYLRRALTEPPSLRSLPGVLIELGTVEALVDGAAGTGHLLRAYALVDDPRTRADLAIVIARTHVFASPPGTATAFARAAGAALPAELTDHRQALVALERTSGYMHGLDPAVWRTPTPPVPEGDGDGARMLAASLAFETTLAGEDRARAVELARAALAGDRLWTVDSGLFWIVAAVVRVLADDDLGDFWHRARAAAHAQGSLFAVHSTNLWQGFWHWRRGELDEALTCLRDALDQARMWGGTELGDSYTRAFEIACHLDRGDLPAARRAADAGLAAPHPGEGGRLLQHAVARLLVAEGRFEEALGVVVRIPAPVAIPNPVWHPWRGTGALALAGLGRTGEAVGLAEEEVRLLRRWGAPSHLGAALRLLGELRGPAGLADLREAVEVLAPTSAAVELARAGCALGRRPEVPDEEAEPLLRAASETAHQRGAAGVLAEACAALEARGLTDEPRPAAEHLSTTERRILDLTAAGLDVREVAERLYLAPGTVNSVLQAADGDRLKFLSSPPTDAVHR